MEELRAVDEEVEPGEEGDDQEAAVGIEPPVILDDDLEDAPEVDPEDEAADDDAA